MFFGAIGLTAIAGLIIGLDWIRDPYVSIILFTSIVVLRILSTYFNWNLPHYFNLKKEKEE